MGIKLGNICKFQSGGTPTKKNPAYFNGTIPWITTTALNGRKIGKENAVDWISEKAIEESAAKIVPAFSIMVGTRVGIGKVAINTVDMSTSQDIVSLVDIDESAWNKEFICKFLQGKSKFLNAQARGATIKGIKIDVLSALELPKISIEEQIYISKVIDEVKIIINSRKQQLEKLDKIVKARFVEMFGDPNINSKKWNECPLSKKLNVLGGYAFKSDQFDEKGGIPVLRIGNINAGYFKSVNMVYWQKDESLERYVMYPGDLVMSLTGTVGKDDYGNVCILNDDYEMYYLNQRNAKLEIKEGIDKYYLSQLLKFEQIKKRLTGISRGVRQANISNKDILNLVVPIPPLELQNQFADFVKQVDKSKLQYHPHTHTCQPNTS